MKRWELLSQAQKLLTEHKIPEASLEAEILLRHVLQIKRTPLFSQPDVSVSPELERQFRNNLGRRLSGEPSAYITGHREFYSLDFIISRSVLIPRPETELLVDKTIEFARGMSHLSIVDVGTGSGAIVISLAVNLPRVRLFGTDISAEALQMARINSQKHGVACNITFLRGNLLEPLVDPVNLVVANLPYIRTPKVTSVNTWGFEPSLALDGGFDGLDKIRELCRQIKNIPIPEICLMLEIGAGQKKALISFLKKEVFAFDFEVFKDLGGIDRVLKVNFYQ